MRKITFLVASYLFLLHTTLAQETKNQNRRNTNGYSNGYHNPPHNSNFAIDYRDAEPIEFIEKGIMFYVFPNGEFDFNTGNSGYLARRVGTQPTTNPEERGLKAIKIEHDFYGRVKRIGNIFVNYDFYGRVRKIGSVYMFYNSFALTKIGGMRLFYNFYGQIIGVTGYINYMNYGYQYNPCPAGFTGTNFENDNVKDDEFYYYKKDGSKEKMKQEDIEEIKKDAADKKNNL